MKITKIILPLLTAALALSSCKSQFELLLQSNDSEAKYKGAFEYYDDKKYSKAGTLFESLAAITDGTERDDTVNFYWGLSNYKAKDYYTAEGNFDSFIERYPRSPFASEANYLRLDCLYRSTLRYELDQKPTYKAVASITEYMTEFPQSENIPRCKEMLKDLEERLDKKAYEGAKLYYSMEDYVAARVALRNVLKDDSDNIYREDIMYYIAMASYKYAHLSVPNKKKERYLTFVDDCLNFFGEFPDSPYRKELDNVYLKAQKALGRHAGDDVEVGIDRKAERKFAKEREQLRRAKAKAERVAARAAKAEQKAAEKAAREAEKIAAAASAK